MSSHDRAIYRRGALSVNVTSSGQPRRNRAVKPLTPRTNHEYGIVGKLAQEQARTLGIMAGGDECM